MNRKLIAILRGITASEAPAITEALIEAGISAIEVPLNSPDPFTTISQMVKRFGDHALIGAGTVLDVASVDRLADIGAKLVVSPNCDPDIIMATKSAGMQSFPGVFTATECFAAVKAGADGLKIFPAAVMGPDGIAALRAVLPSTISVFAVGGASAGNFAVWRDAGAQGFGIGSALYKPGFDASDVALRARDLVKAYDEVMT